MTSGLFCFYLALLVGSNMLTWCLTSRGMPPLVPAGTHGVATLRPHAAPAAD